MKTLDKKPATAGNKSAKSHSGRQGRLAGAPTLKERLQHLREQETGFISSKEFGDSTGEGDEGSLLWQIESGQLADEADGIAGLPPHLRRMCSTPLLTADEEQSLFFRMNYCKFHASAIISTLVDSRPVRKKIEEAEDLLERAERIRNYLLQANTRLVMSIARKFADTKNSFDDLLSHGITSLIRAADKFDCGRGYRFSTYATCAVRRDLYRMVMSRQKDAKRFSSASGELLETISEEVQEDPNKAVDRWKSLGRLLSGMMEELDEREQQIIKARFGFEEEGKKTSYSYLGKRMGISKERVRQLANRALEKLRDHEDIARLVPYCS